MQQALLWAAAGTGFTFSMTALGAAMVFFMKKQSTALMQRIFLGFAAGVMIAASVWSLLIPAIEETEQAGGVGWLPASGGFVLGILLMLLLDGLLPHLHNGAARAEGLPSSFRRTTLLVLAVTLHNIPEGMAVGLSFARAAQHGSSKGLVAAAGALARLSAPSKHHLRMMLFCLPGNGEGAAGRRPPLYLFWVLLIRAQRPVSSSRESRP